MTVPDYDAGEVFRLPDIGRLLPQSPEAEQGVLSAFLQAPREVGGHCQSAGIGQGHFHTPAHAEIFGLLHAFWMENEQPDFIKITQTLRDAKRLDQVGGAAFITQLFTYTPTVANVGHHTGILREKHALRETIKRLVPIVARAYDQTDSVEDIVADGQRAAAHIADAWKWSRTRQRGNGEVLAEIIADYRSGSREKMFGRSTGFPSIDEEIGGMLGGDLLIIAGGPSSGKSALALQIAEHYARRYAERVAYFTFEMTQRQKLHRLLQIRAQINLRDIITRQRELGDTTDGKIDKAAADVSALKIDFLDDRTHYGDIRGVCAEARRMHAQHPVGLLVLDYDELIPGIRERGSSREEELASIALAWKSIAGELHCPAILLSQVTVDDGKTKMRGSSAKLQAGNNALLITADGDEAARTVQIWKSRDGRRGEKLQFNFNGKTTTFSEPDTNEPVRPPKKK